MDEKELIGNYGEIDTEAEKSALEYRPKIKYEPNKPFIVNVSTTEIITEEPDDEEEATDLLEKPTQQYEDFTSTYEELADMISNVEQYIQDVKIPLTEEEMKTLYDSFPSFDPIILENGYIDFSTYKKTFDDPENPSNSLIQDIVHSYAEDVDGDLELEFYEDLKELQNTIQEGFHLYKEAILKHYLNEDIPKTPESNEDFTKRLNEAVLKEKEQFTDIKDLYEKQEATYYESLRTEYGSPEFFQISEDYTNAKRAYDLALRKDKSVQEMQLLVDGLLIGTEDCASRIKYGLVLGSDIDGEEVMKVLENQARTKEELTELLKLTQLSLKLQVNQQIEDKKQFRDVLKNINNLSRKQRAHDELLMSYELRNKMYLNMYDSLQHLESPSKLPGVEAFLNQMAGGLSLVQGQYDSFMQDIYLMYASESEVRKEKISKTLEKENARAGYSLVLDHL